MPSMDFRVAGVCGTDEVEADWIPADFGGSGGGAFWFEEEDEVRLKNGIDDCPRFEPLVVLAKGTCEVEDGATGVTLRFDLESIELDPKLDGRLSYGEGSSDF
jgi:hypothetical protein